MIDYLSEARTLSEPLAQLREAFHRNPELGNHEFQTAARIESVLQDCGIEAARMLSTAVVGTLRGALPGPTVAIRADMDALPILEQTGAAFASQNPGVMHACGHDVHLSAALGAAMLLAKHREELPGTVKFFFQPDEEGEGGAQRMIDAGCLSGVDAVFGAHVTPELGAGQIGVKYGKFYAASDVFHIVLHGKGCHGAEREKGVDALAAAARLVPELIALPEQIPGERCVVSVGSLHSGTAGNIVSDRAELKGIIRTLGTDTRTAMRGLFKDTVRRVAIETDTKADVILRESYPGVVNHDRASALVERTAKAVFGDAQVSVIDASTMKTEDFGYFLASRPGAYYHVGAGCELPLHNPAFLPTADAVITAAALHASVAHTFLKEGGTL